MKKNIYLFLFILPLTVLCMEENQLIASVGQSYFTANSEEQLNTEKQDQLFQPCIINPIKNKNIEPYALFMVEKVKTLKQEPHLNNLATVVEAFHYTKTHSSFTEEQLGKYLFNKKNNLTEYSDNILTSIIITRIGQYFRDIEKDKVSHLTNIQIYFNEINKSCTPDYYISFKKMHLTSLLILKKYNVSTDEKNFTNIDPHFILAFDIEHLLNLNKKIIEQMAKTLYKTNDDSEDLSISS